MKPEISLPSSQEAVACLYPKPGQSSPWPPNGRI